jgi:hypothetical protein
MRTESKRVAAVLLALPLLAAAAAFGAASQKYVAKADFVAPNGDMLVTPIRIVVDRPTTTEERAQLIAAFEKGGNESARAVLEKAPDAGYLEVEDRRAMLKFAYAQTVDGQTVLTVVTAQPLAFLGSRMPEAKPVEGFDLAIATLYVDAAGRGRGELSPAAKIKLVTSGLVGAQDYADKLVQLRDVERK